MFGFLFNKKKLNNAAHNIFSIIIEHSRVIDFYENYSVEDSLDGRFDLMSVHMAIVLEKLDHHKNFKDVPEFKRILQEIMFDNLDLTLREIGVGDLGVGKKIKVMAEAFYGRMIAYQNLFSNENKDEMSNTLKRNLYREKTINEDILKKMVSYIYQQYELIIKQDIEKILDGHIEFKLPSN